MVIELPVAGMHCENCRTKLRTALAALPGVKHADVQFVGEPSAQLGRVRVLGESSRAAVEAAVVNAGYRVGNA